MMKRRTLIKAGAAAAALPLLGQIKATAADVTKLKWGMSFSATDPIAIWAKKAAENIAKRTNGALEIQVFADGALGSDSDMLNQARHGALDIYSPSPFTIASLVASASAAGLPFALKTPADVEKLSRSPVMEIIDADFQKVGLKSVSSLWTSGIRHITNSRMPIQKPDDLKGMKIRVPTSPIMISCFKSLGAAPVAMNVSELYMALQTGLVDAQENPLVVISSRKFQEVQKYCSLSGHIFGTSYQVCNLAKWSALPADLQTILTEEINAAAAAQRAEAEQIDMRLQHDLEKDGMQFNTPDIEAFKRRLLDDGFYTSAKQAIGNDVFEKLEAVVGKFA